MNADMGEIAWAHIFMPPRDMNAGAYTSSFVNMAPYKSCTLIMVTNTGTAGTDAGMELKQADNSDGTGARTLQFRNAYYAKAADFQSYRGGWARRIVNDYAFQPEDSAENQSIWAVTFQASEMKVNEGYWYAGITVGAVGSTQMGAVIGLFMPSRHTPIPGVI